MDTPAPEKYLPPGELSLALCEQDGLCVSVEYIRAVRRESIRLGDGIFVAGRARKSDVLAWMKARPTFSRRTSCVAS